MNELFHINEVAADTRYLLSSLTVFNWGPFSGLHRPAEIDPRGSAIIGATGSGKTTLIDALMTLLVARPAYNLASTGGHDKNDRDLASYVRGIQGTIDQSSERDRIMRPGPTVTGISATYTSGEQSYKIGAILWFDSHSSSSAELHKLWFIIENHEDAFVDMLSLFEQGGKSAVTKYGKEHEHVTVFADSKKQYLARLRRFFEVGENAFDLLNRAAGLKQLNSINQIFRELVLDNKPLFTRALKVAESFDSLEEIYQELLRSRKQIESLEPIARENQKLEKLTAKEVDYRHLREMTPVWFAQRMIVLLEAALETEQSRRDALRQQITDTEAEEREVTGQAQALQARYMEQGGAAIEEIERALVMVSVHLW